MKEQIQQKCDFIKGFLTAKNQDYGGASFDLGVIGNCVHIWDKAKRYKNLVIDKREPNFENIEDTLRDLAGYAIIGLIILELEQAKQKNEVVTSMNFETSTPLVVSRNSETKTAKVKNILEELDVPPPPPDFEEILKELR